jgi:hypothetical protein
VTVGHEWKLALQLAIPHAPLVQLGVPLLTVQATPHRPQLLVVVVAVSHPGAVVQSPKPALQETRAHVPALQLAVAFARLQAVPHPPQLVLVLVGVSQPSASVAPLVQFANPAAHAD